MKTFSLGDRKLAPYAKFDYSSRTPASKTSFARVKVWHYIKQNFGVASNIRMSKGPVFVEEEIPYRDVQEFYVESDNIASVKVSKSISQVSGTFDIMLLPTNNWKRMFCAGDWISIHLYSSVDAIKNDNTNMVLIGNIDRVARVLQKDESTDKTTLRYQVSGRNFGKVFEDTETWFDPYSVQEKTLDIVLQSGGLEMVGNPTKMTGQILRIFLGNGLDPMYGDFAITSPLRQWEIPDRLASFLTKNTEKSSATLFYDVLRREITQDLPGYKTRQMLSVDSNGNIWEMLQRSSNQLINEIFLEEIRDSDGRAYPTIILRPRPYNTPYFRSQFPESEKNMIDKLNGKWTTLQSLAKQSYLEISPGEILHENLGRDDHSRFNSFFLTSVRANEAYRSVFASLNSMGTISQPFFCRESIHRYGLKMFSQLLEFDQLTGLTASLTNEIDIFKAFLAQLYDYYYANHLYESGTIECTGVLEAELGKVMRVLPSRKGEKTRIYYIEGYEHTWTFPGTWRTIFTLARGQWFTDVSGNENANVKNIFIDTDSDDFGADDASFSNTYLVKTRTRNKK